MPFRLDSVEFPKTPYIISVFNNKGGVGKTTLSYHLGHIFSEMGARVLMIDLDPQCNLTIYGVEEELLHDIWAKEDEFIDGFDAAKQKMSSAQFSKFNAEPRSIHYLLRPTEEGTGEINALPPPVRITETLDLIPGRLTLYTYEDRISKRWNDAYTGDPLAIRTITEIRSIGNKYSQHYGYDVVLVDTSPNLGALNKVAISTVDGFIIPCMPDMFSLYGIRNIGKSLQSWKREFDTLFRLISDSKRASFPEKFVSFLGFTIYNAKKYTGSTEWDLAKAHFNYARQIPDTIKKFIPNEVRSGLVDEVLSKPIGSTSVMHSHSTLPAMAQKYRLPMWKVPDCGLLESEDKGTIQGNREQYFNTRTAYAALATDIVHRTSVAEPVNL